MFDSVFPFVFLMSVYESDPALHIKTHMYKVDTPAGKYMIHLEEYIRSTFIIKFYPVRFKKYPNKYNLLSGDNVMPGVVSTALRIFANQLAKCPEASLGFIASASMFGRVKEDQANNQRFRIYRQVMQNLFGTATFAHFSDEANSAYLMVNRSNSMGEYINEMQTAFIRLYPDMFNLHFSEI